MVQGETSSWLQRGIEAAKAGQRDMARQYLHHVVQADDKNVAAWLWLSAVLEQPEEQKKCLERVLSLDPENAAARKGLREVQEKLGRQLLQVAITSIQDGHDEKGRELLVQAVEYDEENLNAWLWLSRVAETPEDQQICLENVLALDPEHAEAREKLSTLQQSQAVANEKLWDSPSEELPEERVAPTLAGAIFGDAYVQQHTTLFPEPEVESESPSQALWAKYDDVLLCPYCAAPTDETDQRCHTCGNSLWVKAYRKSEPSISFWLLFGVQVLGTFVAFCIPIVNLYMLSRALDIAWGDLWSLYTTLGSLDAAALGLSPEVIGAALTILPRVMFFLTWIPFVVLLALSVALYLRWPPVYYLLLASSILELLGSFVSFVRSGSSVFYSIGGVVGLVSSLVSLVLTIQLGEDFAIKSQRILLQVDKDVKNGVGYLLRGRQYAANRLWALAAIHFRRAVGLMPYQTEAHIGLAIASIRLKDYELAQYTLEMAQGINPQDKQIAEVLAMLYEQRGDTA